MTDDTPPFRSLDDALRYSVRCRACAVWTDERFTCGCGEPHPGGTDPEHDERTCVRCNRPEDT